MRNCDCWIVGYMYKKQPHSTVCYLPQIPQFLYHFNMSVKFLFGWGFAYFLPRLFSTPKQHIEWNLFDRNRFIVTILGDYIHNICKWHVCGILWHNKLFRFCTANEDDELSHWTDTKWHYPDRWMTTFDRWAPDNFFFLLSITFWSIQNYSCTRIKPQFESPRRKKNISYLKMK